jgi:23S rRNA (adenine2503-C2)-methyltransferase
VTHAEKPALLDLRSLRLPELKQLVTELGEASFRAKQLYRGIHRRGARSLDELTDLPRAFREKLSTRARLDALVIDLAQESADGTIKYRLKTHDGRFLEAVFMPEAGGKDTLPPAHRVGRNTLCVSSQVGCAMGCTFCRTATMGLIRNLTTGEILDQIYTVERDVKARGGEAGTDRVLTNLVFMGMGEPLHNLDNLLPALEHLLDEEGLQLSHRHITVSTSGLVPEIERFGRESTVKLAISLNGTTDDQRARLMPVNRKYPLSKLLAACQSFPSKIGRRLTFEYVVLEGENDSPGDLDRLARIAKSVPAKVNLIAYNENPGLGFHSPPEPKVKAFRDGLEARGVDAFIRKNRGRDIAAACGQLAVEGMGKKRLRVMPESSNG